MSGDQYMPRYHVKMCLSLRGASESLEPFQGSSSLQGHKMCFIKIWNQYLPFRLPSHLRGSTMYQLQGLQDVRHYNSLKTDANLYARQWNKATFLINCFCKIGYLKNISVDM